MTSVMSVTALDLPLRWAAVGSIRAYQRWLSPYKGFRCAHHVLHRQGSCSHFGLSAFQAHAFRRAWVLTAERLRACRQAYLTLMQSTGDRPDEDKIEDRAREKQTPSAYDYATGACDLLSCGRYCPLPIGDCATNACAVGACSW